MKINPKKLSKIKALLLDCDGVLTNGNIWLDSDGEWRRFFNIQDGMGIRMLIEKGFIIGLLTASDSQDIKERVKKLQIPFSYLGSKKKIDNYLDFKSKTKLDDSQIAYVGDDVIDIEVLKEVGFAVTVPNCVKEVRKYCDYMTQRSGGEGAVREVCDLILKNFKEKK